MDELNNEPDEIDELASAVRNGQGLGNDLPLGLPEDQVVAEAESPNEEAFQEWITNPFHIWLGKQCLDMMREAVKSEDEFRDTMKLIGTTIREHCVAELGEMTVALKEENERLKGQLSLLEGNEQKDIHEELLSENYALKGRVEYLERKMLFDQVSAGMVLSKKEMMRDLAEEIMKSDDLPDLEKKLEMIKRKLKKPIPIPNYDNTDDDDETHTTASPEMKKYVEAGKKLR
jgi:hypothetical protein